MSHIDPRTGKPKIILDLCGGTGSWSKPYKDAGYDVRLITLPDYDVRTYEPPADVYGILVAPPCTHFSIACNRLWAEKDRDGRTIDGLSIFIACLMIISRTQPVFWALENPVGRAKQFLVNPDYKFVPCDFGWPTKKKTYLWGNFNTLLEKSPYIGRMYRVEEIDYLAKELFANRDIQQTDHTCRAAIRSITPPGFAQAFYKANR